MSVDQKLKAIRQYAGLNLDQLAELLGISPEVAAEYENGRRPIPVNHLERLGGLVGLRLIDLVDEARGLRDLKARLRPFPAGKGAGDLQGLAEIGRIAANLDEMGLLKEST
jgi:transcriptional regulator with XRE-family HTH domain